MINSTRLASAIALAIGVGAPIAALAVPFQSGDVLTIEDGVPSLDAYGSMNNVGSGSFFVMDLSGDKKIGAFEKTIIDGLAGITIGSASSPGEYDTWMFSGNVGEHYSNTVPVTGSTETGLDFSGWTVFWNGGNIDMGTNAWAPLNCDAALMAPHSCTGFTFASGVASIQWSGVYGDPYELWYSAIVPTGNFTGTQYAVYLTGVVLAANVNVPPVAGAVTISNLAAGATVNWTPVVSDVDTGDTLGCSIEVADVPSNGTATVAPDCSSGTYTHDGGTSTTDSFTYTVSDGTDTDSAVASVTLASSGGGGGGGGSTPGELPPGVVVLQIAPGVQELNPDGSRLNVSVGSWFGMDTSSDDRIAGTEKTALEPGPDGGLIVGAVQAASGSHSGPPNGSENTGVDAAWNFFGNTGLDFTVSAPAAVGGNTANGIDMSGWRVTWNAIPSINLGTGAWAPGNCAALDITTCSFSNGTAQFTWDDVDASGGISDGDTYRLIYAATVPPGDPSGFGNVRYLLNLEGTMSVTPSPNAGAGATLEDGDLGGTLTNGYRPTQTLPADSGYSNVGGFYDYKVNCGAPGCSADVYMPLSALIPANAVLRKYGVTPGNPAGGWATFASGGGDNVASGNSTSGGGDCAAATYSGGLTTGHDCLRLTLTDGGPNDTDPTAGIIGDPSGIAVPAGVAGATDLSSGSSGCTLSNRPVSLNKAGDWLLIGLAFAGFAWTRHRAA